MDEIRRSDIRRIVWTDRGVEIRRASRSERPDSFEFRHGRNGFRVVFRQGNTINELRRDRAGNIVERPIAVRALARF